MNPSPPAPTRPSAQQACPWHLPCASPRGAGEPCGPPLRAPRPGQPPRAPEGVRRRRLRPGRGPGGLPGGGVRTGLQMRSGSLAPEPHVQAWRRGSRCVPGSDPVPRAGLPSGQAWSAALRGGRREAGSGGGCRGRGWPGSPDTFLPGVSGHWALGRRSGALAGGEVGGGGVGPGGPRPSRSSGLRPPGTLPGAGPGSRAGGRRLRAAPGPGQTGSSRGQPRTLRTGSAHRPAHGSGPRRLRLGVGVGGGEGLRGGWVFEEPSLRLAGRELSRGGLCTREVL